jgi:hypothetical protein
MLSGAAQGLYLGPRWGRERSENVENRRQSLRSVFLVTGLFRCERPGRRNARTFVHSEEVGSSILPPPTTFSLVSPTFVKDTVCHGLPFRAEVQARRTHEICICWIDDRAAPSLMW